MKGNSSLLINENLIIPTYTTLIPNEFFYKSDGESGLINLLELEKINVPTKDRILKEIANTAKSVLKNYNKNNFETKYDTYLNELLFNIPNELLLGISNIESWKMRELSQFIPESILLNIQKGLFAKNYYFLNEDIKTLHEIIRGEGREGICDLVDEERFHRDKWEILFNLDKNNILDLCGLNYLLENEVRDCSTFKISGDVKDYRKVAEQIKNLSYVFRNPLNVSKLRDESAKELERICYNVLIWFLKDAGIVCTQRDKNNVKRNIIVLPEDDCDSLSNKTLH